MNVHPSTENSNPWANLGRRRSLAQREEYSDPADPEGAEDAPQTSRRIMQATRGSGQRSRGGFAGGAGGSGSCGPRESGRGRWRGAGSGGTFNWRRGGQDQAIDNGGVQVFIDAQEIPQSAFGFPLEQVQVRGGMGNSQQVQDGSMIMMQVESLLLAGGDSVQDVEGMMDDYQQRSASRDRSWDQQRENFQECATEATGGGHFGQNPACDYPACSGHIRFGCGGDYKCYYDRYDEDCIGKDWGEDGCFHDGRAGTRAADDGSDRPGKRSRCPRNMAALSEAEQAAAGSQSWMTNVAFPNPANFSRPLSTLQASEVYESRQTYNIQLDGLFAGQHYMYAYAGATWGRSSGWHGGWFELKDQFGDRVAGGEVDGVVEGEKLQVDFVVEEGNMEVGCICRSPCSNKYMRGGRERTDERWHCEPRNSQECDMEMFDIRFDGRGNLRECTVDGYTLTIRTESTARDVSWQLDDGSEYAGPHKAPIYIGAKANMQGDAFFVGSMAGIQISGAAFPRNTVECMYLAAEENIGRCADPRGMAFKADLLAQVDGTPPKTRVPADMTLERDTDSVATADITMYGETHLDRDYGAIFDGVNDYLTFEDTGACPLHLPPPLSAIMIHSVPCPQVSPPLANSRSASGLRALPCASTRATGSSCTPRPKTPMRRSTLRRRLRLRSTWAATATTATMTAT